VSNKKRALDFPSGIISRPQGKATKIYRDVDNCEVFWGDSRCNCEEQAEEDLIHSKIQN